MNTDTEHQQPLTLDAHDWINRTIAARDTRLLCTGADIERDTIVAYCERRAMSAKLSGPARRAVHLLAAELAAGLHRPESAR